MYMTSTELAKDFKTTNTKVVKILDNLCKQEPSLSNCLSKVKRIGADFDIYYEYTIEDSFTYFIGAVKEALKTTKTKTKVPSKVATPMEGLVEVVPPYAKKQTKAVKSKQAEISKHKQPKVSKYSPVKSIGKNIGKPKASNKYEVQFYKLLEQYVMPIGATVVWDKQWFCGHKYRADGVIYHQNLKVGILVEVDEKHHKRQIAEDLKREYDIKMELAEKHHGQINSVAELQIIRAPYYDMMPAIEKIVQIITSGY